MAPSIVDEFSIRSEQPDESVLRRKTSALRFRVLEGFAVEGGDSALDTLVQTRSTPRRILAALLFEGGALSLHSLHMKLGAGTKTLRHEATRLRVALGGPSVFPTLTQAGHLELCLGRDAVDLWRFRDHLSQARRLRDHEHRSEAALGAFEAAEAVWVASEQAELASPSSLIIAGPWFKDQRAVHVAERRQGRHEWAEPMLSLDRPAEALACLERWSELDDDEALWIDRLRALVVTGACEAQLAEALEGCPAAARPAPGPTELLDWYHSRYGDDADQGPDVVSEDASGIALPANYGKLMAALEERIQERISELERRVFFWLTGGVLVTPALSRLVLPSERLALALDRPSRLDYAILDELAVALDSDQRLDKQLSSREVLVPTTAHLRMATEFLAGSPPPSLRPRVASLAARAAGLVGWLHYNLGHASEAEAHYQLAVELAEEAGDHDILANVLGAWSRIPRDSGDSTRALALLDRAAQAATQARSATVRSHLAASGADTLARLGGADASLRWLDQAEQLLAQAAPAEDPAWIFAYDQASLIGWKGSCYLHLGRFDEAEAMITSALSTRHSLFLKERGFDFVDLAFIRLGQGELDECCRVAGEALDIGAATGSGRIVQRIRDLRRQLQPQSQTPAVVDLDTQLSTITLR